MSLDATEKSIKILVVGDSGVGKTSIVHLLCENQVKHRAQWTVGASPNVLIYKKGNENYFIELWDIGGARKHEQSRSLFYQNAQGLILVHDLTNKKTYRNLKKWMKDISSVLDGPSDSVRWVDDTPTTPRSASQNVLQLDLGLGHSSLPVLIFGNKQDEMDTFKRDEEGGGMDNIHISALEANTFRAGSFAREKLNNFFDAVIDASSRTVKRRSTSHERHASSSSLFGGIPSGISTDSGSSYAIDLSRARIDDVPSSKYD